jgi:RND family efflux transporter MFP subunit
MTDITMLQHAARSTPRRAIITRTARFTTAGLVAAMTLAACGSSDEPAATTANESVASTTNAGTALVVTDTTLTTSFAAAGIAEPLQQATVSTKLMGTVNAVLVQEGDMVRAGQTLVQIDARDLDAKATQVEAAIADAEAMQKEAATHAARFTALYQDSAATRAQYDAAMTGLARADAGLRAARAGSSELAAVRSYATVRAPFSGMVTLRMVDAGSFAAPGAPLITLQDISSLRLSVTVPADVARHIARGQRVQATVDGDTATARIEGVVPAGAGGLYTVNALLDNRHHARRAGSAVTLRLATGTKQALVVPQRALVRDGDLVGVVVRHNGTDERRWIRIGDDRGALVEVTSGLRSGETIVVPAAANTGGN